jgi:hypothetical protein
MARPRSGSAPFDNRSLLRGLTWRDEQWLELVRRVEALEAKP